MKTNARFNLCGGVALCAVIAASCAYAAGFALREQSVTSQGASYAGATSSAENITNSFWNPAGLTQINNGEISINTSMILPRAAANIVGSSTGSSTSDTIAVAPSLYAAKRINKDLVLGLSINAPFGLISDYGDDFGGRFSGDRTRVTAITATPMIGFQISPELSVGFGVQVESIDAKLTAASSVAPSAKAKVTGHDTNFGLTAGVLYQPTEGTNIGLGYRQGIQHELKGTFTAPGGSFALGRPSETKLNLPDTISAGITQSISPDFRMMAEVQWQNWENYNSVTVNTSVANPSGDVPVTAIDNPQGYNATWFLAFGGEYDYSDALTLRAGLAYDQTPTTDQFRTVRVPDQDRLLLSAGASYDLTEAMSIDVSYSYLYFLKDAKVSATTPVSFEAKYNTNAQIISIGGRYRF